MSETTERADLIVQYSQLPLDIKYMRLIAHDVRNQMNTIMMANDMLREEIEDAEGNPDKYITMISHASEDILLILEAAVNAIVKQDEMKKQAESQSTSS